jgi:hypothetical protein
MRLHLFELADQPWFPHRIRTYMTDYLAFMAELGAAAYGNIGARIAEGARRLGVKQVVELGAGAAGPSVVLARAIRAVHPGLRYILTDLHPNLDAWEMRRRKECSLEWESEPVDATSARASGDTYRVLCNCFHHFEPDRARSVLRSAFDARAPIAVIEVVERSPLGLLGIAVGTTLVPLATPFVRPFSLGRLLFTYVVPVVPMAIGWDGFVSCLRIYSPAELEALVANMQSDAYIWEAGRMKATRGPGNVTYLIGEPTLQR